MQDDEPQTNNNMQAEENYSSNAALLNAEPLLLPGPSLLLLRKVIPNSVTILATMVGLSAVPFALEDNFKYGVVAILISGVLDGLDGPIARALSGTSRFGAELDSLSDYVNFGVSPALLLYFWSLKRLHWYGWIASLSYTICMGCRLARFNAGVDFNANKITRNFFMGVPAPAGAMLALFPMMCSFQFADRYNEFSVENVTYNQFLIPYLIFISYLLISRVPTFSSKMLNSTFFNSLSYFQIFLVLTLVLLAIGSLLSAPWLVMTITCFLYMCSFPVSYIIFKFMSLKENRKEIIHSNKKE